MTAPTPTHHRIDVGGAELEVRERGSGEPVVFIHGGDGGEPDAVVKEPVLAGRHRLIDYHRRGWGASEAREYPVSIARQAADCKAVLHALGIERAHVAGQSYGGAIALQLALDHSDAVHSLALMEPALPALIFESPELAGTLQEARALYEAGEKDAAVDTFAQGVCGPSYRADFAYHMPPGHVERWIAAADAVFGDASPLEEWTFGADEAAQIVQPVLSICGAATKPAFRNVHETLCRWIPHAERCLLPDASHGILQTNPPGAAARMAGFFARHPM